MSNVTQTSLEKLYYETQDYLSNKFKDELVFDEEVDKWMFISTPWPVLSILTLYLLFVYKFGPRMMKNRKPINLKFVLLIYNTFQSLSNAWLILLLFTTPGAIFYHVNHVCHPSPRSENQYLLRKFYDGTWYFLMLKIMDLLDTVFFVLRKKDSQVTFLHVYHHVNMVFSNWAYLRFIKGEQLLSVAVLNSFVHVIMYAYYFLSAFGPRFQKYLWWKKYLTRLQITQFIFVLAYSVTLFAWNCSMPKLFISYVIVDASIFLYLFSVFYLKAYRFKNEEKVKST